LTAPEGASHNFQRSSVEPVTVDQTLVLNATYEPLRIVSWQKAITLLFQGKVEVIASYDREIRGVTVRVRLPSVLRLLRHVRMKRPFADVPFSRANVYARDDHSCQYCDDRFAPSQLTFDHVIPVARGGRKAWDNIVTCCIPCNRLKGDRTPEEAGMRLVRRPRRPEALPSLTLTLGIRRAPESWRDYLFWDVAWDKAPA
jgi:5-methylcytosine-specific restriction endonuclease McrA